MADQEQRADEYMAQAQKKEQGPKGVFGSFAAKVFGDSGRLDDAADLYIRAANSYKMAKKWGAAGNAFCSSAKVHLKQGSKHNAATNYVDSANCFKKSDPNEAVSSLLKAIEIYTDLGKFTVAAKHHQAIAEIFESDLADLDKAITHYEQAADYFKGEESTSSASKCLLKVALFSAQQEKYEKAVAIYEEVGIAASENSLLKYAAKGYFFNAAICQMCIEADNAGIALGKYQDIYPAFSDSRECKLIKSLLEAIEAQDVDQYTQAIADYDSISRLDQWTTTMLLRVKKTIEGEGGDLR